MIQCREQTGLALEASAAFRIARQVSWEQFDRDLPAETQVPGAVHFAHPADAEDVDNLKRAESLARS